MPLQTIEVTSQGQNAFPLQGQNSKPVHKCINKIVKVRDDNELCTVAKCTLDTRRMHVIFILKGFHFECSQHISSVQNCARNAVTVYIIIL